MKNVAKSTVAHNAAAASASPTTSRKVVKQCLNDRRHSLVGLGRTKYNRYFVEVLPDKLHGVKFVRIVNSVTLKCIFMKPISEDFDNTPSALLDLVGVVAICDLRDYVHPELNNALLQEGTTYPFKMFVCACGEDETDEEFGRSFAAAMQSYLARLPGARYGPGIRLIYRQPQVFLQAGPQPVRHWLRDRDMLLLLKKIYGWSPNTTLEDVMAEEEVITEFFDSVEEGQAFLGRLNEEQWQSLEA